jgi:serine carboxypeptidase-like clade 1
MPKLQALVATTLLVCVMCAETVRGQLHTPGGWVTPVPWLPGWPKDTPFPAPMHSGFVNITNPSANTGVNQQMFMHYFLFESERDPATDPVIFWWNGGPGASSAWGLFVENGPLLLNDESLSGPEYNATSIPQLIENPYSWTKFATIVAFCNPPPIGFSYCSPPGPAGNGTACGTWNDTRVGVTDAEAIRVVLTEHFPRLKGPVHFMGESYAGVYIGETLRYMLEVPLRFGSAVLERVFGVALGDACLGGDVLCGGATGPYSYLMFFYGHGQVSTEIWNDLNTVCTYAELHSRVQTTACTAAINNYMNIVGGYYAYNLYDQCTDDAFQASSRGRLAANQRRRSARPLRTSIDSNQAKELGDIVLRRIRGDDFPVVIPKVNGYWCPGLVFFNYFDRMDVRQAAAVPLDSTFFNADDGEGMNYVYNCMSVMPTLLSLIRNTTGVVGHPVRVWAYDGDGDPSVNVFSTQQAWWNFTKGNALAKSAEWRAWTLSTASNIVGGYVTQWANGTLSYVTVRGSGHMVPEYKPVSAMILASTFVSVGGLLPPYKP